MRYQADTHSQAPLLELADALRSADHIVVGAGAGLSTSAGFEYGGERFLSIFGDFAARAAASTSSSVAPCLPSLMFSMTVSSNSVTSWNTIE